jgi:hypothetical protein
MKKILIAVFLISAAVVVYSQTGVIREFTGEVELKPVGASAFSPAQVGNQVTQDTIISTGFRSTAVISVGSSLITVRPLTRLSLSEIQSSAGMENLNVNLQTGRIRVDVKPPAGTRVNTTVQSPNATASVRGTVLEMDTNNLSVIEGTVDWEGSDSVIVAVSKGSSTIDSTGSAQDPISISSAGLQPSKPVGTGMSGEILSTNSSEEPFPELAGSFELNISW